MYSNGYIPMRQMSTTVHIAVTRCVKNHESQYVFVLIPIICIPSRRRSSFSTTTDFMMMTTLDMNASAPMMEKTAAAMIPPRL